MNKPKILLGAHMSIAGGFNKSIERGESIACTAIQIFTKSNRQWQAKEISINEALEFKKKLKNSSIRSVIAHASYLINIGSCNKELNLKSYEALKIELQRCQLLEVPYLVLHPGSRQESTEIQCLEYIIDNINKLFEEIPGDTSLLIENMAGMGSSVGHKFEQLAQIIHGVKQKSRIGICFDTCHAFAAGYSFNNEPLYKKLFKEFDSIIGINKIKAFHINDSAKDCGSKIDRHAFLTKGKIDIEGFAQLFNDPNFFDVPKLLETPINSEPSEYIPDLTTVVNLLSKENIETIKETPLQMYLKEKGDLPFQSP